MYQVTFAKQALKDIKLLKAAGLSMKAKALVDILERDPFQTPPPYEALVGNFTGLFSRRINIQHRLVYRVVPASDSSYEGIVHVLRMWSHYERI